MTEEELKAIVTENSRQISELTDLVKNINQVKVWMDVKEAAAYVGVSAYHLRSRLKSEIGFFQRSRKIMFRREDLDTWMNQNCKQINI